MEVTMRSRKECFMVAKRKREGYSQGKEGKMIS